MLKQTTEADFYRELFARKEDIMPRIMGAYPYTSEYRDTRTNALFGKAVGSLEDGRITTTYYIEQRETR
jgi:hypothetical protein